MTQAGALRKNAGTASSAEITRTTTTVLSALRLPRDAGTSATRVMRPSAATPRLTARGGGSADPIAPTSATSISASTTKIAVTVPVRGVGRTTAWCGHGISFTVDGS
jgi:hypothetical protein